MKKIMSVFSLIVLSVTVSAETFTVKSVGIDATKDLVFVVFDKPSTQTNCVGKSEFKWKLSEGHAYAIYSLALHAHSKNVLVDVSVSQECVDGQPTGNWIKLHH